MPVLLAPWVETEPLVTVAESPVVVATMPRDEPCWVVTEVLVTVTSPAV